MDTVQAALAAQLTLPAENSKKYKMTVKGLEAVLVIFLAAGVAFILRPDKMQPILTFAAAAFTAVSGLVAVFVGATAVVDRQTTIGLSK